MNGLRREKFEKWCEQDAPHLFVNYLPKLGCYSNSDTQTAWESWCSAIESVVVEFTEEVYFCPSKTELEQASDKGFSHAMEMVKVALDKAGIKYE